VLIVQSLWFVAAGVGLALSGGGGQRASAPAQA
jgi:hypothetical protein